MIDINSFRVLSSLFSPQVSEYCLIFFLFSFFLPQDAITYLGRDRFAHAGTARARGTILLSFYPLSLLSFLLSCCFLLSFVFLPSLSFLLCLPLTLILPLVLTPSHSYFISYYHSSSILPLPLLLILTLPLPLILPLPLTLTLFKGFAGIMGKRKRCEIQKIKERPE